MSEEVVEQITKDPIPEKIMFLKRKRKILKRLQPVRN